MVVHVRLTVQKYIKFLHGRPIRTFFYTFLIFNVILHILLGRDALYLLERALQDGAVGEAAVLSSFSQMKNSCNNGKKFLPFKSISHFSSLYDRCISKK